MHGLAASTPWCMAAPACLRMWLVKCGLKRHASCPCRQSPTAVPAAGMGLVGQRALRTVLDGEVFDALCAGVMERSLCMRACVHRCCRPVRRRVESPQLHRCGHRSSTIISSCRAPAALHVVSCAHVWSGAQPQCCLCKPLCLAVRLASVPARPHSAHSHARNRTTPAIAAHAGTALLAPHACATVAVVYAP